MADSSVAITAGTGTSVDTRTESNASDHRQVVVVGDPVDGNRVGAVSALGEQVVQVQSDLLNAILRELKIHSLYLSVLTGTEIKDSDVGEIYQ